jgi:hypothetical protein
VPIKSDKWQQVLLFNNYKDALWSFVISMTMDDGCKFHNTTIMILLFFCHYFASWCNLFLLILVVWFVVAVELVVALVGSISSLSLHVSLVL